jgi:hypothetical protein
VTEWESKGLLGDVPRPREKLTRSRAKAVEFAAQLDGPVVAKASGVAHKTEAGAVRVGLDAAGVERCWDELARLGDGTVLIAEEVRGEYELIVGGLRDAQFGAVVSVGLGGVAAEVFRDAAFALAPLEPGELDSALDGLRGARLLAGWRGAPALDRGELAKIVDAVAGLLDRDPGVVEVDCNPVIVRDGRPLVADALVVKA